MNIDETLLAILACPVSKAPLVQEGATLVSTDTETRLRYRIDEGIPVLIVEESETVELSEWNEIMDRHGVER
jgi:uncharacterized protein YbaR (Trm112 family)